LLLKDKFMKNIILTIALIFLIGFGFFLISKYTSDDEPVNENTGQDQDRENSQAIIKTSMGDITVELYDTDAPKTVENFIKLTGENFYDNTRFHRVIKDFMIQAGDPFTKHVSLKDKWGTGGPGYTFEDEINSRKLIKGSLAMANSGPNTNGSQFFIISTEATPWLDGLHTNFGQVISGMDIIERIENVETGEADQPIEDVMIEEIVIK